MRYIALLAVLAIFPACLTSYSQEATTDREEAPSNTKTVVLEIEGMVCTGCPYTIEAYLEGTPGIINATVSYRNSSGVVVYNPSRITEDEILQLEIFSGPFGARVKE